MLLTRLPLYSVRRPFSLDLHVLSTPPAFILSHRRALFGIAARKHLTNRGRLQIAVNRFVDGEAAEALGGRGRKWMNVDRERTMSVVHRNLLGLRGRLRRRQHNCEQNSGSKWHLADFRIPRRAQFGS